MRKFSYTSVLRQISDYIHRTTTQKFDTPQAPWLAERLALWAIRDDPAAYGHEPMQAANLQKALNLAWNGMDKEFRWFSPDKPLTLSLRALLLAQLPHQRSQAQAPFVRQIELLNRIKPNSRLYQMLEQKLGMPPLVYLQIAALFRLNSEKDISRVFAPTYQQEMVHGFGELPSRNFFRTLLVPRERTATEMREVIADEWFQPNLLYRSPFTVYRNQWFFWGRCCLDRNLEYTFSDIVGSGDDQQARQMFEEMFENYVGRSLGRSGRQVLDEKQVRARFKVEGGCCDFAVLEENTIVLVEVKNKALAHTLPASAPLRTYQSRLKGTVMKAAEQLRNTAQFVRAVLPSSRIHRVAITYGDLLLGKPDYLFEPSDFVDSVHVFCVDHVDRLVEAVRLNQCTFHSFFEDYIQRQSTPGAGLFSVVELLDEPPYQIPQQPQYVLKTFEPFFESMLKRFNPTTSDCETLSERVHS
jgi:Holliday junction resolvase-like predicted endonuclease